MARTKITAANQDLITDDGSVLVSVIKGEQLHLNMTLNWLTNLTGYTIFAKVIEGANDGAGSIPTAPKSPSPVITELPILDKEDSNNQFILVIPQTLGSTWSVQPGVDTPVYGFVDMEIQDTGIGDRKQIWKPFRGLIEIRYSPTEVV